jgi:hypothetical protein
MAHAFNLSLEGSSLEIWNRIVAVVPSLPATEWAQFTALLSRRLEAKAIACDKRCEVVALRWRYAQGAGDRRGMDFAAAEGTMLRARAANLRKIRARLAEELAQAQVAAKPRKPRASRAKKQQAAQPAA